MARFIIVPAQAKKGMKKFTVDMVQTKGNGVPLNPDAENPFDVKYVLPDTEQLKAGLPHYYRKSPREIVYWVQSLPGNLQELSRLPVRVDLYGAKGNLVNQLYCYLKKDNQK